MKIQKNGKEIIGVSYYGKEIRFPYNGIEDPELLSKLENCQIIFDEKEKMITSAWNDMGERIYSVPLLRAIQNKTR